jgi:hypothetical protein
MSVTYVTPATPAGQVGVTAGGSPADGNQMAVTRENAVECDPRHSHFNLGSNHLLIMDYSRYSHFLPLPSNTLPLGVSRYSH